MGVDDVDNAETFCRGIEISSDWGDDEVDYVETFCQGIRMSSSKFDTAHSAATWGGSQNVTWTPQSACADQEGKSNFGRALWNWWAWQARMSQSA